MDGLYIASFATPLGNGIGVVIGVQDDLFGGDEGYAYSGEQTITNDGKVQAQLVVRRHTRTSDKSVFGDLDSFTLNLTGSASTLEFAGTSPQVAGITIQVSLKKAPNMSDLSGWTRVLQGLV